MAEMHDGVLGSPSYGKARMSDGFSTMETLKMNHICNMRGRLDYDKVQNLTEVVEILKMMQLDVPEHMIPDSLRHVFDVYDANARIMPL